MGTNYYVATNCCDMCGRYDQHHIGKSSYGWSFSFRGYKEDNLTSWAQWKEFLADKQIIDEYKNFVDYDQFCLMIETTNAPNYVREDGHINLQHNTEGKRGPYKWFDPVRDWDDEAGYSFTTLEFS